MLHCPIYTTLSVDLEPMYIPYLVEYWYTLRFCDGSDEDGYVGFKGTVNQGNNEVCFQLNRFRLALGLNYGDKGQEYEDPICAEDARSIIDQIGYLHVEGDRRVTKVHMNGEWNLLFAHIIQCMGTYTGSHDQANVMQCQIAEALMTARGIDFAALIFDNLKNRVMQKK